jgi:hypothetical protein
MKDKDVVSETTDDQQVIGDEGGGIGDVVK